MNSKIQLTLDVILVLLCMLAMFLAGYYFGFVSTETSFSTNVTDPTNCSGLALPDASRCLRDYVAPYFNYTLRDDVDKPIENVLANGGDCYDYSLLYTKLAVAIGLNGTMKIFKIQNNRAHAVAFITSPDWGYCMMDQLLDPVCVPLALYGKPYENQTGVNNETFPKSL